MREYRQHSLTMDDGAQICVFESGRVGEQQVVLAHAAGFHARCWDKVVEALPQHWHVLAVDIRGHGRSAKKPPYVWDRFAKDLISVAEHFDVSAAIGVGHSLGGHCITHVCALEPSLFARLLLIDPVIFPPEMYRGERQQLFERVEDHPVARRRGRFSSWREMYERFENRAPYSLWRPNILRDYCEYGVLPAADGDGVELACPPVVEASGYMSNFDTDIFPLLDNIQQPVTILRAKPRAEGATEMDFATSPTWPALATAFANAKDVPLPELTHFIPMQEPEMVANYICGDPVKFVGSE